MDLTTPLSKVLKTTKDHLVALQKMDIRTAEDLLYYIPRTYEDLSQIYEIHELEPDTKATLRGTVSDLKMVHTRTGKKLVTANFADAQGEVIEVIWFNQPHIKRMLSDGDELVLTGRVKKNGRKIQLQSPVFEPVTEKDLIHAGRLVPVYPQHDLINTKWLREKMVLVKTTIDQIPETLPKVVLTEHNLISKPDAIRALHFPESGEKVQKAKERMAFEEMYFIQMDVLKRKLDYQGYENSNLSIPMDVELIRQFFKSLKFTPTGSQKIAIYEILKDMEKVHPMSRLLEGDVGSGKTLVATAVMANVIRHGGQCALMVPTEVLARQHVQSIGSVIVNFNKYLNNQTAGNLTKMRLPVIALLIGSLSAKEKDDVKQRLNEGRIDLVIGTHALIEENVRFKNLKLVIVDEQHRFGVLQRDRLKEKGSPHFLSMTATPIPRTLALTAQGQHDLSVLMEKPGNRLPIHTKVVPPSERRTVEHFIDQQISEGRQVFVICPLISQSQNDEMAEIKSVKAEAERLKESFPHRNIALLHGKLKPSEKAIVMKSFKEKHYDILVSTSVIEVGIDVPNASLMIIEGAERFGLSQLHQFRGRVGRGIHKSHCFLFTTQKNQAYSQRLKAMEKHDSGFLLAEIDLQIRGPGELFGLKQSGIPMMQKLGLMNPELVIKARKAAERYLNIES